VLFRSQWATMIDALEGYGAKHNHCNVSQCHKYKLEDGSVVWLGAWLQKQRELRKKGLLKADRLSTLQALVEEGMLLWDPPSHTPSDDEKWDIMLAALKRYADQFGHCNLSAGQEYSVDDGSTVKLGAWLSQQRHHRKKGKLRADREARLQVLVDQGKLFWGMRGKSDCVGAAGSGVVSMAQGSPSGSTTGSPSGSSSSPSPSPAQSPRLAEFIPVAGPGPIFGTRPVSGLRQEPESIAGKGPGLFFTKRPASGLGFGPGSAFGSNLPT